MRKENCKPSFGTAACFISFAVFFAAVALCRVLDTVRASWVADVTVDAASTDAIGIVTAALFVLAGVAFAAASVTAAAYFGTPRRAYLTASLMSGVILLDRTYFAIYNFSTKVRTYTAYPGEAVFRDAIDFVSFAAAFFVCAAVAVRTAKKREAPSAVKPAVAFSAALAAGQVGCVAYDIIKTLAAYGEVSARDRAAMVEDVFFAVAEYGLLTFPAVIAFYLLIAAVLRKIGKKSDKTEKV